MRQRKKEDTRKLEPAVHEEGTENDPVTLVHDAAPTPERLAHNIELRDRKSTRLNSSHGYISYAVFCLKKKKRSLASAALVLIVDDTACRLHRCVHVLVDI